MTDIIKNLYGENRSEKINSFKDQAKKIQENHIKWFNSEFNKLGDINEHYRIHFDNDNVGLAFHSKSNLPSDVSSEIKLIFKTEFSLK